MPIFEGASNFIAMQNSFKDSSTHYSYHYLPSEGVTARTASGTTTTGTGSNNGSDQPNANEPQPTTTAQTSTIPVTEQGSTSSRTPSIVLQDVPTSAVQTTDDAPGSSQQMARTQNTPATQSTQVSGNLETNGADRANLFDSALAISTFVLSALESASKAGPVPFLQTAASMALNIVNSTQGARNNEEDFERLAADACDLVYIVINIHKVQGENMSNDLDSNLENLVKTLKEIEQFGQMRSKRHRFKRFLMSSYDARKVHEYRERLSHALNGFWLQSSIHVRQQLASIAEQQGVIHKDLLSVAHANPSHPLSLQDMLATLSTVDFSRGVVGRNQGNTVNSHS